MPSLHCPVAWCSDPTDHIPSKAFATVLTSITLEWKCYMQLSGTRAFAKVLGL